LSHSDLKQRGEFRLDSGMRLGAPTLRVRDLESELSFYENYIGFAVKRRSKGSSGLEDVELGPPQASEPVIRLRHDPLAKRPSTNFAGLYHYAVLLPKRRDLASTFLSIGNSGVAYEGFADHTFSEALYLHDAERNGMEIYADRPRTAWPDWNEMSRVGYSSFAAMNGPLDFDSLLGELDADGRAKPVAFPNGARIGHIHLRVTDLAQSVRFYRDKLGLDVNAYIPEIGAAFLSVGGYHHHLGLNTWHSEGGSAHREGEAGLEEFRMILPKRQAIDGLSRQFPESNTKEGRLRLSDPDGIQIEIEAGGRAAS
jgi:catechol 2,3-dioxygenase